MRQKKYNNQFEKCIHYKKSISLLKNQTFLSIINYYIVERVTM